jgi:hypothetical protein
MAKRHRRARPAAGDEYQFSSAAGHEYQFSSGIRNQNAKIRMAALAGRQFGRVRYDQIRAFGIGKATVNRWCIAGYLHLKLPRVYAVGHPGRSTEADLAAALLYAGPGAMLSHSTAAWWLGLLQYPPPQIIVSSPRRVRDIDNIVVHGRRHLDRIWHNRLPVTTPSQAILDFAANGRDGLLRLVLANADYHDLLNTDALQRLMGRRITGTAALRQALDIHLPQLADTRSRDEVLLLELLETYGLPIPLVNVFYKGWLLDAYWPPQRVVVEIDGIKGHRTRAQLESNHRRDFELRQAGLTVFRYTRRQLTETHAAVAAELDKALRVA